MSEPDPRLLERLFPGPKSTIVQNRRNVSAAAPAGGGGSNKVREDVVFYVSMLPCVDYNQLNLTIK